MSRRAFAARDALVAPLLIVAVGCGARSPLGVGTSVRDSEPEALACIADLPRMLAPSSGSRPACGADASTAIGLYAITEFDLMGVSGAAGPELVHRFFAGQAPEASGLHAFVRVRGGFAAASVTRTAHGIDYGDPFGSESVLIAPGGAVAARFELGGSWDGGGGVERVYVSDRGLIAVAASFDREPRTLVGRPGGVLADVAGVHAIAEPGPSGHVAVREEDSLSSSHEISWIDPCAGMLVASAIEPGWSWRTWGHRLVFVDDGRERLMVEEAPGLVFGIPLGERGDLVEVHPAGHALLATERPGRAILADLTARTARTLEITLPAGHSSLVQSSDSRLFGARPSSDGRLYLPLGIPIGQVHAATAREANGSFYLVGDAFAVTLPTWAPPPAGVTRLDHGSAQLMREDGPNVIVFDLDLGSGTIDDDRLAADGGCVAREIDGGLRLIDPNGSLREVSFEDVSEFDPIAASTFVPGPDVEATPAY